MDIQYAKPLAGEVLQALRYESGIDTSPGTLVKVTTGKLAAVAADDTDVIGYAMNTKDVSETADDFVSVMPFVPGHVFSIPAVSGAVVGDPLGISGADAMDEDAVNTIGRVVDNGGDTSRTYFVIVNSGLMQ